MSKPRILLTDEIMPPLALNCAGLMAADCVNLSARNRGVGCHSEQRSAHKQS
jgi:hypothetical protein